MTEPGYVHPPAPGWWVRTDHIGVTDTNHEWAVSASGVIHPVGLVVGSYSWAGASTGLSSVIYGSTGAGVSNTFASPVTFSHVGVNGDVVVLNIIVDRYSVAVATYDGVAMKFLGRSMYNPGFGGASFFLAKFSIPITAGNAGTKTISITNPGGGWLAANSVSYQRVLSVGIPNFVAGTGTTMTQAVTCPNGSIVEQAFGVAGANASPTITHSGGTSRYLFTTNDASLGIRDTNSSLSFTGTISASKAWGGGATVLNPYSLGPQYDSYGGMPSSNIGGAGASSFTGPVVTAGADVFVDIMVDRPPTLTAVTYNGVTMTLLNTISFTGNSGNSLLSRYRVTGVAGGAKTISFTIAVNSWCSVAVSSFTGVTSVASTTTANGTGTAPSQAATCTANQIIVQTFGFAAALTANSTFTAGPANLWDSNGGPTFGPTVLNVADASTTFGMSSTNAGWGGLATVLS